MTAPCSRCGGKRFLCMVCEDPSDNAAIPLINCPGCDGTGQVVQQPQGKEPDNSFADDLHDDYIDDEIERRKEKS